MKKIIYSFIVVVLMTTSMLTFAKHGTGKIYCLNAAGTACDAQVIANCLVDRGLGILGTSKYFFE